jgi:hypothetical protein
VTNFKYFGTKVANENYIQEAINVKVKGKVIPVLELSTKP